MLASFLISQHYSSTMPDLEDSLGGETLDGSIARGYAPRFLRWGPNNG